MIVAFAGQKGGVGKSTSSVAVACELMARGRSVLLVDADPQLTCSTWGAVATENGHPAPTVVAMGATMHREGQLAKVAAPFDWTIIDCPPRHDAIQRSALMVADAVLLPCGPSAADAWALAGSVELVEDARTVRPALRAAVLLTRQQSGTTLAKGARTVLEGGGLPILVAELAYRVAYQEALAAGQGVGAYAPGSPAAAEVVALVDELERFTGAKAPRKAGTRRG